MNRSVKFSIINSQFSIPIVFLLFIILCSFIPALAETYIRVCYPIIAAVLSFFSRLVAFSLMDMLIIAAIVLFFVGIVMMFMKRLSFRRWLKIIVLSVLWLLVWFYMSWGVGYFRPDFYERFEIQPPKEDKDFFETLVIRYIDSLNNVYLSDPYFNEKEVNSEIERLYEKRHELLRLPYPCGWRSTKITLIKPLMTRAGVSGYFGPFFNEVHVNDYQLPLTYPYTLAHEKAHQFGIANESECNLYATLICTSSEHPLVRYSGYMQTVSYLLGNLRKISPDNYKEIVEKIDPRIIADYSAIREHWKKALNEKISAVQEKVYDSYLKTNKQQSGILSYSEMTGLLVAWEMKINN